MIYSENENYESYNDLEIDQLLAELPFELMKENIKAQINDPLSTRIDYVKSVIEKCEILKNQFEDNEDVVSSINQQIHNFFKFIINEIDAKFELNIDEDILDGDNEAIGAALYNFLILKYKKNVGKFIYRFIIKNKKCIVEQFEKLAKKKDVTSIALKKQLKNKDDILILSNLPSVIKYIMNLYIEPLDFLKYSCDEEYYEGVILKQLINNGYLVGNFVTKYLEIISTEYDDIMDEIQAEVKFKLMKKIV